MLMRISSCLRLRKAAEGIPYLTARDTVKFESYHLHKHRESLFGQGSIDRMGHLCLGASVSHPALSGTLLRSNALNPDWFEVDCGCPGAADFAEAFVRTRSRRQLHPIRTVWEEVSVALLESCPVR